MKMQAMVLHAPGQPLVLEKMAVPEPGEGQILVKVGACGVCRTDLHVYEGDLSNAKYPIVLGHEIVGQVEEAGVGVNPALKGRRVGIPWLGRTCGRCKFCHSGKENLCDNPEFTGYTVNGGFAEYTVADHRYCFPVPENYDDAHLAPLLCAGLIGFRAYKLTGDPVRLGLYGFGAAAHILAQLAAAHGREVFAFTRPGDSAGQEFARRLGAVWAGGSNETPPQPLDAAIIFAPVGELVPAALQNVCKGGIVVCAGIHMSPIPSFSYDLLWGERRVCSVANLTRQDGVDFFEAVRETTINTSVQMYDLDKANAALEDLKNGRVQGAAVLKVADSNMRRS